jgi:hypothetical protein
MSMVCGLDLHRGQITFDALEVDSGEVWRGRIWSPDRARFRRWLHEELITRAHGQPVAVAVEGCTGWRYVVEEITAAGLEAHVAEPADTQAARGRKKHAKTDQGDGKLMRELLRSGDLSESRIPPEAVLDWRERVRLYKTLLDAHAIRTTVQTSVMTPRERWQLGLAILTAYVGPDDQRAADITLLAGGQDPREIVFGVLAVARELLSLVAQQAEVSWQDVLQSLAETQAGEDPESPPARHHRGMQTLTLGRPPPSRASEGRMLKPFFGRRLGSLPGPPDKLSDAWNADGVSSAATTPRTKPPSAGRQTCRCSTLRRSLLLERAGRAFERSGPTSSARDRGGVVPSEGAEKDDRPTQVKATYDPDNVFHLNADIGPAANGRRRSPRHVGFFVAP